MLSWFVSFENTPETRDATAVCTISYYCCCTEMHRRVKSYQLLYTATIMLLLTVVLCTDYYSVVRIMLQKVAFRRALSLGDGCCYGLQVNKFQISTSAGINLAPLQDCRGFDDASHGIHIDRQTDRQQIDVHVDLIFSQDPFSAIYRGFSNVYHMYTKTRRHNDPCVTCTKYQTAKESTILIFWLIPLTKKCVLCIWVLLSYDDYCESREINRQQTVVES